MAFDGLIHLLIENNEDNLRQRSEVKILQRNLRDTSNPFNLPDVLFLKLFRLNKFCSQDLITSLTPHLNGAERVTRVPIHLRVLTALNFFGQGTYQLGAGHGYTIAQSQSTVSRCIAEVSDAIVNHLLNIWIKFPDSDRTRNEVKRRFQEISPEFPDLIGAIDCTHIKIISPPAEHPVHPGPPYYCRKGYFSINTQIIGDSNRRILSINARYPGSVHDSAIWMLSGVKRMLQQQYVRSNGALNYLIGDGGYPLEPWLLVPFVHFGVNSPEARYNTALSKKRAIIEYINGLLRSRFRCLHGHRALHYDPIRAAKIIYSCAVLHNMCRFYNVPLPVDEELLPPALNDNGPIPHNQQEWYHEANRIRQHIVETYFQLP